MDVKFRRTALGAHGNFRVVVAALALGAGAIPLTNCPASWAKRSNWLNPLLPAFTSPASAGAAPDCSWRGGDAAMMALTSPLSAGITGRPASGLAESNILATIC